VVRRLVACLGIDLGIVGLGDARWELWTGENL
jgi:hypothetical protein